MLDDDIKKLLIDLNMKHFIDENEKLQAIPVSKNSDKVILNNKPKKEEKEEEDAEEELWQKVEDHPTQDVSKKIESIDEELDEQIKRANKKIRSSRKLYTKAALLLSLLTLSGLGAYLLNSYVQGRDVLDAQVEEVVAEHVEEIPAPTPAVQKVVAGEENASKGDANLVKLFDERKNALKAISDEINALIASHAEKKLDSFASKLTGLAAKCQAIDEDYTTKIAAEIQRTEAIAKEQAQKATENAAKI